jgi:hypothetical protein
MLKATTITGTLVKAFNGRNISAEGQKIMNIEACEYRNAFLKYTPDIAVVTNIDPDHLDFFKTEAAYTEAFHTFARTAKCLVMLTDEAEKKGMIGLAPTTVLVSADVFEVRGSAFNGIEPGKYSYTLPVLLVPRRSYSSGCPARVCREPVALARCRSFEKISRTVSRELETHGGHSYHEKFQSSDE